MTRRLDALVMVLAAMLVLAAVGLTAAPQRRMLPPGAALLGQVVDAESGVGLQRSIVEITGAGLRRRVVSDDRGRFLFTGLPAGDYQIHARRAGYLNGTHGQRRPAGAATVVTVNPGQWIGQLDVRLWKPGVITGDVRDDHGDPVVGITVRAYRHERASGRAALREVAAAVTDDTGQYRLASLVPGDHMVGISSQTFDVTLPPLPADAAADDQVLAVPPDPPAHVFAPYYYPAADTVAAASRVSVVAGRDYFGVSFMLSSTPAVTVSGQLVAPVTPDGLTGPVPLMLTRPRDPAITESPIHRVLALTTTDAEGRFTFPQVPSGHFEIEAAMTTPDGSYWAKETVTITDEAITDVVVTMQPALDVQGRIRVISRDSRAPHSLDRVAISFEPLFDLPDIREIRATIDETGAFRTGPALTPGPYLVRVGLLPAGFMLRAVMSGGRDVADHPLDLSAGFAAADLEVTLTDQRTSLIGTVRGEGPFGDPTTTVLLFPPDAPFGQRVGGARRFRSVRTTREGTFTIRDLPPGAYLAVALDDAEVDGWQEPERLQQWKARATPLNIREGEAKVIELRRLGVR